MSEKLFSRRELLRSVAILGAAAVLPVSLSGCSKKDAASCLPTGLAPEDETIRTNVQYVEASPEADKNCTNCLLYKPAADATACGGCNLLKGTVNPKGYCKSWAKKA